MDTREERKVDPKVLEHGVASVEQKCLVAGFPGVRFGEGGERGVCLRRGRLEEPAGNS